MKNNFGAFNRRSSDFGAYIFGDVIDGSLAKTTCYNLKLPKTGKELLACGSSRSGKLVDSLVLDQSSFEIWFFRLVNRFGDMDLNLDLWSS